jgi:hypothetical protein
MIGLTTYELKKRRENISPLRLMEAPDEARFSRIFDFASSRHEESSPPQMKMGPGYLQVSITFGECQVRAQPVARRWLVSPLIIRNFRGCYFMLARGNLASANLNHQKWPRARLNVQNASLREAPGVAAQRSASSAWKRRVGGIVRLRAWTILRLMPSSKSMSVASNDLRRPN